MERQPEDPEDNLRDLKDSGLLTLLSAAGAFALLAAGVFFGVRHQRSQKRFWQRLRRE